MSSGITSPHPDDARGTIGISTKSPSVKRANPARMMPAGRRVPARFPASNAIANMLSDSGAIDRPAPMALYSSTICR